MARNNIGTLTLDLVTRLAGFIEPLSKAERELKQSTGRMNKMANDFGRSLGTSLKSVAGGFLAFAGVSVSFDAVASSIKSAID